MEGNDRDVKVALLLHHTVGGLETERHLKFRPDTAEGIIVSGALAYG